MEHLPQLTSRYIYILLLLMCIVLNAYLCWLLTEFTILHLNVVNLQSQLNIEVLCSVYDILNIAFFFISSVEDVY